MESNSDRGACTPKPSLVITSSLVKSSLQNRNGSENASISDLKNYKKSAKYTVGKNLTDIDNGSLTILKDRYLLTSSSSSAGGSNSTESFCLDIENNEKYLCKVITEPYEKVLRAYFECSSSNAANTEMFETENKIRSVKDIIPISQDRTYLLLEPQHFGNLHTYIRDRRRLAEPEARTLFRQICETVQICHRYGVVLRDLKLRKFYFNDHTRTKIQYESLEGSVILDSPADDRLNEKIGCPLYVAPELITTTSSYNGKPADMWALGVILYTMLVGKYPFNDLDGQNLFSKILSCNVTIPFGISSKAKCLLKCLLRRQPTERLTIDDIFYHPWFQEDAQNNLDADMHTFDAEMDQCVPEQLNEGDAFELT